eukprot:1251404-Alexandrium_andersonii.AAC.1
MPCRRFGLPACLLAGAMRACLLKLRSVRGHLIAALPDAKLAACLFVCLVHLACCSWTPPAPTGI